MIAKAVLLGLGNVVGLWVVFIVGFLVSKVRRTQGVIGGGFVRRVTMSPVFGLAALYVFALTLYYNLR
jgi:hypothetical protein